MKKKTFYITTPIFYPSGALHIGHFYTLTIAQTIYNFKKMVGYDALLLTGCDEHGEKIKKKALSMGLSPKEYVDLQAENFRKFLKICKFDYQIFSRTTNTFHKEAIQKIYSTLKQHNNIFKDFYKGLYSVEDEEFVTTKDALKMDHKLLHPVSKHELQIVEQLSYFFDMKRYEEWIKGVIAKNVFDLPSRSQNELSSFLSEGLENLSISRTNLDWGIRIPDDQEQVIYVWLDALFNYVTHLGFQSQNESLYKKFWEEGNEIVHVVGKEIARFHCIYWPIFLHALGVRLPNKIISHGWIVAADYSKMSKSKGNAIDPVVLIERGVHPEVIKYFLIRRCNFNRDMRFVIEDIVQTHNTEIVNLYGNLVARTIGLFHQKLTETSRFIPQNLTKEDTDFLELLAATSDSFASLMHNCKTYEAIEELVKFAREFNNFYELKKPWNMEDDSVNINTFLNLSLNVLYGIVVMLSCVMPESCAHYLKILNFSNLSFEEIKNFKKFDGIKPLKNEIFFKTY